MNLETKETNLFLRNSFAEASKLLPDHIYLVTRGSEAVDKKQPLIVFLVQEPDSRLVHRTCKAVEELRPVYMIKIKTGWLSGLYEENQMRV